mgnify:CR=1 FL=1
MGMFLSQVELTILTDHTGKALKTKENKQLYRAAHDITFMSETVGCIVVPKGFITDLASVPRLPFIYAIFGDSFQMAAIIHDYLYSAKSGSKITRKEADAVLVEACDAIGESWWRSRGSWLAVRAFGWLSYSE